MASPTESAQGEGQLARPHQKLLFIHRSYKYCPAPLASNKSCRNTTHASQLQCSAPPSPESYLPPSDNKKKEKDALITSFLVQHLAQVMLAEQKKSVPSNIAGRENAFTKSKVTGEKRHRCWL